MTVIYTYQGSSPQGINFNAATAAGGTFVGAFGAGTETYGFGNSFDFFDFTFSVNSQETASVNSGFFLSGGDPFLYAYGTNLALSGGQLTGTTISHVALTSGGTPIWDIAGSIDPAAFWAAQSSAGTSDDQALIKSLLTGDDLIRTSDGTGVVDGGRGRDYLLGIDGTETLNGGAGDDLVMQKYGKGKVAGGLGNDILISYDTSGSTSSDVMLGGPGKDILALLGGSAWATGGSGADQFVVHSWDADKFVITDFSTKVDTLFMPETHALWELTITHTAKGMLIKTGSVEVLLKGVAAADFHPEDIVLGDYSLAEAALTDFAADFQFLA